MVRDNSLDTSLADFFVKYKYASQKDRLPYDWMPKDIMPNPWTPNPQYRIGLNAEFSNAEWDLIPKSRVPNWTEGRIFEYRTGLNAEIPNTELDWMPNGPEGIRPSET